MNIIKKTIKLIVISALMVIISLTRSITIHAEENRIMARADEPKVVRADWQEITPGYTDKIIYTFINDDEVDLEVFISNFNVHGSLVDDKAEEAEYEIKVYLNEKELQLKDGIPVIKKEIIPEGESIDLVIDLKVSDSVKESNKESLISDITVSVLESMASTSEDIDPELHKPSAFELILAALVSLIIVYSYERG